MFTVLTNVSIIIIEKMFDRKKYIEDRDQF
jgi:hypothetical protein